MKDYIDLFAPKKLTRIISEYLAYSVRSFFRYWLLSSCLFISILVFFIYNRLFDITVINCLWAIVIFFLVSSIPGFIILYKKENLIKVRRKGLNVGILETVMIKEKEYLSLNLDSTRISEKQSKLFHDLIKTKYPFRDSLITPLIIQKPKLFYYLHDLRSLKKNLISYINPDGLYCILIVLKDIENKKIEFDILQSPGLLNSDAPITDFKQCFNRAVKEDQYDDYILEVSKVFISIYGQSIIDLLIDQEQLNLAHKIIDDCEDIFIDGTKKIANILNDEANDQFELFKTSMLSNFERHRGILYLNQKQYTGAIRHIFKAVEIHPFFPYLNYGQYKKAFNKRYIAEINLKAINIRPEEEELEECLLRRYWAS